MAAPVFWIVNPDAQAAARWEKLGRQEGWAVFAAAGLDQFLDAASRNSRGIALVDWSCLGPTSSGAADALRKLRAGAAGLSFVLSSAADLSDDQVIEMLEAGADDYVRGSIHPELLAAKLKAHLRRTLQALSDAPDVLKSPSGDLKLDRNRRELWLRERGTRWTAGSALTPTEVDLLALFLERPGAVLDRRFIMETLWRGESEAIRPGTVDKHVESLRRKLKGLGGRVRTVYGAGYAYRESA